MPKKVYTLLVAITIVLTLWHNVWYASKTGLLVQWIYFVFQTEHKTVTFPIEYGPFTEVYLQQNFTKSKNANICNINAC